MHPHLHMLASFALVDLAQQARVGAQICKQAADGGLAEIPGELLDKGKGIGSALLNNGTESFNDARQAVSEGLSNWTGNLADAGNVMLRNKMGLPSSTQDINISTNPMKDILAVYDSIQGAQGNLSKVAPGLGAAGGGLLGAGLGAGAAKLLQGTPEDEEDEKSNRLNMILAALAGGGLGAVGGGAASLSPLVQEKLQALGRSPAVRGGLEAGAGMYGAIVTKIKDLITKLMASKGGGGGTPAGGGSSYNPPGPSPQELLGLGQ